MAVKHLRVTDLQSVIRGLKKKQVAVGYLQGKRYPADENGNSELVAVVAATQEFGSAAQRIPPRPTLRPALENAKQELAAIMLKESKQALTTGDIDAPFTAVGLAAQGKVREAITELTDPPLSQATIDARAERHSKGLASDKPLVDSGHLLRSVEFEVQDK